MPLARPVRSIAACVISCVVVLLLVCSFASLPANGQKRAFYTHQQRYRFGPGDPRCSVQKLCNLEIPPSGDYSLNFIEFKDDGTPYPGTPNDESQIDMALDQIHKAQDSNDGNVLIFIYIHGWHNSAEERTDQPDHPDCGKHLYTGDVDKFRHCGLEVMVNNPPQAWKSLKHRAGAAPRVVGIYLAWRGWDFGYIPLRWVPSYYLRMPKARSIGLTGMNDALCKIFNAIDLKKPHLTIAMGHSFGARVLEAALDGVPKGSGSASRQNGILWEFRKKHSEDKIGPHRLPVDFVFYVNAATSHADTIRTKKDWDKRCKGHEFAGCEDDPLYFAVSAREDLLTALVMPVANLIAMPVGFALRGSDYSNGYHLIAAANTPWMQTHNIPVQTPHPPAYAPAEGFCFAVPRKQDTDLTYVAMAKPTKAKSRLWAMNSDRLIASLRIISNHGDVWNAGVFNMVRSVIDTQSARVKNPAVKVQCRQTTIGQH